MYRGMLIITLLVPGTGRAQDSTGHPVSAAGVLRAAAMVDSVFVDRRIGAGTANAGDFTAYLMARLGMRSIPDDFRFRVESDSQEIRIFGRVADLPPEAQATLSPLVAFLTPEVRLVAEVELARAGRQAVRFHLRTATIGGIPVPEPFLASVMAGVGRQYPALTASGRDLYIQIPEGGAIQISPSGVRLIGP